MTMFCTRCKSELPRCTCDDRDERLRALAQSEHFVTDRCVTCAQRPAKCDCATYTPASATDPDVNTGHLVWSSDMPAEPDARLSDGEDAQ